jgi:uncharacterized protein YkwD
MAIGFALPAAAHATPAEESMLAEINEARRESGVPTLRESPLLSESAADYSRYMIARDYFGHLSSLRMSDKFTLKGEVLAWHSGDGPRVGSTLRNWIRSSAHRAVILHPKMRYVGAGLVRGRLGGREASVWTIHFGRF